MKLLFFSISLLLAQTLMAAEGHGGEHSNEIPGVVLWQVINLAILFGALYYYTKDKIVETFKQRQLSYLSSAEKSQKTRAEAERNLADITDRLKKLRANSGEAIARAQAESADLKKKMQQDSQQIIQRIKNEAEITVQAETQKAIRELRNIAARDALESAREVLSKDIGAGDHQSLQGQFSEKVEAVTP